MVAYAGADDIRLAWVNSNLPSGSAIDNVLNTLASAASRELDRYLATPTGFWRTETSSVRYFNGNNTDKLYVDKFSGNPLFVGYSDNGVVDNVSGTGGSYNNLPDTDYFTFPFNSVDDIRFGIQLDALNGNHARFFNYPRCVKIGAYWGHRTVPDEIKQATVTQAVRWYKRGEQSFADVGAIKDLGQIKYMKGIDPEVEMLVFHLKEIHV